MTSTSNDFFVSAGNNIRLVLWGGETEDNIKSIRPGNGLLPKYLDDILGKKAIRNLKFGEPLSLDMIDDE